MFGDSRAWLAGAQVEIALNMVQIVILGNTDSRGGQVSKLLGNVNISLPLVWRVAVNRIDDVGRV